MKILIAPDSFKESLTAVEAAAAIADGLRQAMPAADLVCVPLADGGEGTAEAFATARDGTLESVEVMGPLGDRVKAHYAMLDGGQTAVVELAQASGLALVPVDARDPLAATSFGTGELIRHALERGCERVIVGIGGSATNDGGVGLLQALGVSFTDASNHVIDTPIRARDLDRVASIDLTALVPSAKSARVVVACDVDNPLLGPRGASAVFGPQKGADAQTVAALDAALEGFYAIAEQTLGVAVTQRPGAGAAGGVGAALMAFLDAEASPGIDLVMEAAGLAAQLRDADLVVTGEGRLDAQTLHGKAPVGVARAAAAAKVPVIAIGGGLADDSGALLEGDFDAIEAAVARPMSENDAIADARRHLQGAGRRVGHWIALGQRLGSAT